MLRETAGRSLGVALIRPAHRRGQRPGRMGVGRQVATPAARQAGTRVDGISRKIDDPINSFRPTNLPPILVEGTVFGRLQKL